MEEIWKSLNGLVKYGDYYEVSSFGNIRSIDKIDRAGRKRRGHIKKQTLREDGYKVVSFKLNGKQITHLVHRLIALAFIPNPECYQYINHKDGNKSNNDIDNLEWCTHQENMQHAYDIGLNKSEGKSNIKLTGEDVVKIRGLYNSRTYKIKDLSILFGVSARQIEIGRA